MRQVPLATPFGRLAHERGGIRGVLLSAAVHVGVVALLLWGGSRFVLADRAPGPGHGRGGGGGGGGNRTLVLLVPPPPPVAQPAPPPQEPQVVLPKQLAVVVPAPQPDTVPHAPAPAASPALGPGAGAGQGAGAGPGAGTGSGGGSGSGVGPGTGPDSGGGGGRIYPPFLQGLSFPFNAPRSLKGQTITAVFQISETGEVLHVALDPVPDDRGFAREMLDRLRQYKFIPAHTVDGQPVAALYRIKITL